MSDVHCRINTTYSEMLLQQTWIQNSWVETTDETYQMCTVYVLGDSK